MYLLLDHSRSLGPRQLLHHARHWSLDDHRHPSRSAPLQHARLGATVQLFLTRRCLGIRLGRRQHETAEVEDVGRVGERYQVVGTRWVVVVAGELQVELAKDCCGDELSGETEKDQTATYRRGQREERTGWLPDARRRWS